MEKQTCVILFRFAVIFENTCILKLFAGKVQQKKDSPIRTEIISTFIQYVLIFTQQHNSTRYTDNMEKGKLTNVEK